MTFEVDYGPAVIVDGFLTPTRLGTIRVTARQAGDSQFLPFSTTRVFNQTELQSSIVGSLEAKGKVRVQDHLLFIAGASLEIYDVSDPSVPAFRGRLEVSEPIIDLAASGPYVLTTTGNTLKIADVSQPGHPTWVGTLDLDSAPQALAVEGSRAAVTRHPFGVDLIDWSDPLHPKRIANVTPPPPAMVSSITLHRDRVFFSGPDLPVASLALPSNNPGSWDDRITLGGQILYLIPMPAHWPWSKATG